MDAEIDQDSPAIFGNRPFTLKREKEKAYLVTLRENESIVPYAGSHVSIFIPIQLSITPASPTILIP